MNEGESDGGDVSDFSDGDWVDEESSDFELEPRGPLTVTQMKLVAYLLTFEMTPMNKES